MSLNQLVDPTNPLDITVNDLNVEGAFDIGTAAFDDVLITGTTTLSDLTTHGIVYIASDSTLESKTLTSGQLLIGSTGADPVAASLTAASGITVTSGIGSITLDTAPDQYLNSVNTAVFGLRTSPTVGYVLTCEAGGAASWQPSSGVSPSADLVVNTIQLDATSEQIIMGPTGGFNPLILSTDTGIASETVTFPRTGADSQVVLSEGEQTINGEKYFSSALLFERLQPPATGANVLITRSPNLIAETIDAVIIGGDSDTPTQFSACTMVGVAIAETCSTVNFSVLLGSGITVDNESSHNIIIGASMSIAGNGQIAIGNTSATDFYSLGSGVKLGTIAHPWGTITGKELNIGLGSTNRTTITTNANGAARTNALPNASGVILITDLASISQGVSPTTAVTSNTLMTLITTQTLSTAGLSSTSFTFNNTFSSSRSTISISGYTAAPITNGIPSVIISGFVSTVSMTITIFNSHPTNALSGVLNITVHAGL